MTITTDGNGTYFNGNWLAGVGQNSFWDGATTSQVTSTPDASVGDFVNANRDAQGRANGIAARVINTGGWFEYAPLIDETQNGAVTSFASDLDSFADMGNESRVAVWLASNNSDEQRICIRSGSNETGIVTSSDTGTIYNFNFFNSTRRNWSVHTANTLAMFQVDLSGVVTNWVWVGQTENNVAGSVEEAFVAFGNTEHNDVNWGITPNGGGATYTLEVASGLSSIDYTVVAANGGSPSGSYVSDLYIKWSSGPNSGDLLGRCPNMFYGVGSFTVGDFYEIVPATSDDEPDPSGTYFGSSRPIYACCIATWGVGTYIFMRVGDTV